jgi:GRAS domain family
MEQPTHRGHRSKTANPASAGNASRALPAAAERVCEYPAVAVSVDSERGWFERLVADTAYRPRSSAALRVELERQLPLQTEPCEVGLDELAALLARWLAGNRDLDAVASLASAYPAQPLIHFYAFAMRREAGDVEAANRSVAALRELDAADPLAAQIAAHLAGEPVAAASEEVRLANIAKLAATPLLRNPYQLAVGAIFEAIREREVARVLDVGVGSGAQLIELLTLLCAHEHRVRRLELVGLDFMDEFLERAGRRIADARAPGRTEVVYVPVRGRIEELDDAQVREIAGESGLDAANATIALHEVPGVRKLAALRNLRRVAPAHLLVGEWNYCLENTLPETSVEFLLNVRQASADFVSALTERFTHDEARAVVRDWLSQAGGQLTCSAAQRQECFLHVASWQALLEHAGFGVAPVEERWLAHAEHGDRASIEDSATWIATTRYAGWPPIALLHAVPD